jgi:hypothetical protein
MKAIVLFARKINPFLKKAAITYAQLTISNPLAGPYSAINCEKKYFRRLSKYPTVNVNSPGAGTASGDLKRILRNGIMRVREKREKTALRILNKTLFIADHLYGAIYFSISVILSIAELRD